MPSLIVLYDSVDLELAEKIGKRIERLGVEPWLADSDTRNNWREEIKIQVSQPDCIGAVAVWSGQSQKNSIVIDEATLIKDKGKALLNLLLAPLDHAPIGFGSMPRLQLVSTTIEQQLDKIENKIKSLFHDHVNPTRGLNFGDRFLAAPSIILSVSSFETQIAPTDALKLLRIAEPEALLISAYDILRPARKPSINNKKVIQDLRKSGSIVFLDSGNYEAMRFKDQDWRKNKKRLAETLEKVEVDVAFTHDNIPRGSKKLDGSQVSRRVDEICKEYERDNKIMNCQVAPIIHAIPQSGNNYDQISLPHICTEVAMNTDAQLIAVAERELGDGILARAKTVAKIREALSDKKLDTKLHILGTGNPISAAMLSKAGADFFDGLEWCRTAIDGETLRLYHFQQWDYFTCQSGLIESELISSLIGPDQSGVDWFMKAGLHNIAFFMQASKEINQHHTRGELGKYFSYRLKMTNEYKMLLDVLDEK